jgi:hypothetical protein
MTEITFTQLNHGWNAEPNDPAEAVIVRGDVVELSFVLNSWEFEAEEGSRAALIFRQCIRWRLGSPNDEGWYRGQCRFDTSTHSWGEFYEIVDPIHAMPEPTDWQIVTAERQQVRHFLFYLRDNTFECFARDWALLR